MLNRRTGGMVIAALLLPVLAFAAIAGAADPPRGAMRVPGGGAPCIRDRTAPASYTSCSVVANGLQGAMTAVVSPDGKNVYVTGFQSDSVASFSRDQSTGALTPLPGAAACMKDRTSTAGAQCGSTAIGIKVAIGLAISPDGKSVYVAGVGSDAVAAFSRNPDTGALTQLPGAGACIKNE